MRSSLARLVVAAGLAGGCAASPDDPDPAERVCALPASTAPAGSIGASQAQMCNVSGSMGRAHWYRLAAALPGTSHYVQVELWDNTGAFVGGTVRTGSFPLTGVETGFGTCGVCVRALGDKGGAAQKEYFATGGTVDITAVGTNGAPIAVALRDVTFAEIDASTHKPVASGCTATVASATLAGTVMQIGGGGGGGGGGGAGGAGQCPLTIGD